jgi:hypothetical protein
MDGTRIEVLTPHGQPHPDFARPAAVSWSQDFYVVDDLRAARAAVQA